MAEGSPALVAGVTRPVRAFDQETTLSVFVLDKKGKPLMPCSEKRARLLLEAGRARVHRVKPFTIRLVDREQKDSALQPVRVKLDPGSKVTGIALVRESETADPETGEVKREAAVLNLIELEHRGQQIKNAMQSRAALRRGRRSRNLRYRKPRRSAARDCIA